MRDSTSTERDRASATPLHVDSTAVAEASPGRLRAFGKQLPVIILAMVVGLPAAGAALAGVGGVGVALQSAAAALQAAASPEGVVGIQSSVTGGGASVWIVGALVVLRVVGFVSDRA